MTSLDLSSLNKLVDVLIRRQHRLILLLSLILASVRTTCVDILALNTVLTVLGGLHVPEETQDVGIVAAGLPQLVQLPGQLGGDQVRVRRESRGTPVHRAHRVLPAALRAVTEAGEDSVQP